MAERTYKERVRLARDLQVWINRYEEWYETGKARALDSKTSGERRTWFGDAVRHRMIARMLTEWIAELHVKAKDL
jgi:hypothetical protein